MSEDLRVVGGLKEEKKYLIVFRLIFRFKDNEVRVSWY